MDPRGWKNGCAAVPAREMEDGAKEQSLSDIPACFFVEKSTLKLNFSTTFVS